MKNFENYEKIIAIKEKSNGNASVGDMWIETKSFLKDAPIKDIIEWAEDCGGKLTLTIDETGANNNWNPPI